MIGLLLRPAAEPEVVEVPEWNQAAVSHVLGDPATVYRRTFEVPGYLGRMSIAYGTRAAGPANIQATALAADELPSGSAIRGPALILRSGSPNWSLTEQDCMALAALLVASERHPVPGRDGRSPRRGRHRAGKPAPTRGEPC